MRFELTENPVYLFSWKRRFFERVEGSEANNQCSSVDCQQLARWEVV